MPAKINTPPIQSRFYDFIDVLRDAHIRISTDEILSLFNSLSHTVIEDRNIFRQTLKTTLIKDYTDIPLFDECFTRFFEKGDSLEAFLDEADNTREQDLSDEQKRDLESRMDSFLDELTRNDIFEKTAEELLSLFLDELMESDSGGGGMGMMLFQSRSSVQQSYSSPARRDGEEGLGEGERDNFYDQLLLGMMKNRLDKKKIGSSLQEREDYLFNKYIYQLTPAEIREMRELIKRFGQKLKNRISLRKKKMKHGSIDIKRTFRSSLQYDGIPFKIYNRNMKIDRPQLVVLCDISGSVSQYTRFMLLLTHTLQGLFSKVRTFAFISTLVEITPLFREMDPERAMNSIFADTDFTYGWGSNYGRCFDQFIGNYSDALNKKTSVLVLGDARNNNQDPGLDSFIKIKERSRNIFWLNPDRKHLWDWSDSIASVYQKHCVEMKEVNNFLDLSEFIDKLFLDK